MKVAHTLMSLACQRSHLSINQYQKTTKLYLNQGSEVLLMGFRKKFIGAFVIKYLMVITAQKSPCDSDLMKQTAFEFIAWTVGMYMIWKYNPFVVVIQKCALHKKNYNRK